MKSKKFRIMNIIIVIIIQEILR